MDWKLFANLAEEAGEKRVSVDLDPDATVADALNALFAVHPELEDHVLEDGDLVSHLNLLKNGEDVSNEGGLETPVSSNDELALFPPVSGG